MANTTATVQQKFSTAILTLLAELKSGDLKDLGEHGNALGGESFTFYRQKESVAKDGVPSMYPSGAGANQQDGGDMLKFKATIDEVSSQDKVKKVDMKKTKIDIKNSLVKSMARAILKKEDAKILEAIRNDGRYATAGGSTLDPASMECARELIAEIRNAYVGAEMTPDGVKGVAIVMNRADYKRLASSDAFIHGDFKDTIKTGNPELPDSMAGARLVVSSLVPTGEMFIIPSNTFGYAEWENSADVDVEYVATDGQTYHLQIVKSMGVVVIEPEYITKFEVKPNTKGTKKGK